MIEMFVIYERPTDYPKQFVVRRWEIALGTITPDDEWFYLGDTLEEVRARVPRWLRRIPRQPEDEPQIVEVWI